MRKNISRKIRKNMKGITLIALVVTIVILLILTGIVLDVSIGDNAVLNRATEAAKKTKRAQVNDYLTMKKAEIEMDQFIDSREMTEDIAKLALDKRVVGVNNIKLHVNMNSINGPEDMLKDATVEATIKNGNSYYTTELKLGEIKNADGSSNLDIEIGELKQVTSVSEADQIILAAIKAKYENRYDNQYTLITYKSNGLGIRFIPTMMISDNINNKYYEDQCKISYSEIDKTVNILITFKEVTLLPMKLKVNSGEDCRVNFDMQCYRGTIDWGDGQTDDVDELTMKAPAVYSNLNQYDVDKTENVDSFNRMELKANSTKIASIDSKFKIADVKPVPYYVRQHTYDEANKEYEIQINGITPYLKLSYSGYYDDEEDEVTDYQKITSIEQWGSVGAISTSFSGCKNLKTVAEPTENTFEFGVSLVSLFENCKSLESIPANLFSNCKYLENCSRAFYNCTGLTEIPEGLFDFSDNKNEYYRKTFDGCINLKGEAPMLWKNAKPSRRSRYKGYSYDNDNIDYEDAIPDGDGCFGGCEKLSNYDDIPDYWKWGVAE